MLNFTNQIHTKPLTYWRSNQYTVLLWRELVSECWNSSQYGHKSATGQSGRERSHNGRRARGWKVVEKWSSWKEGWKLCREYERGRAKRGELTSRGGAREIDYKYPEKRRQNEPMRGGGNGAKVVTMETNMSARFPRDGSFALLCAKCYSVWEW